VASDSRAVSKCVQTLPLTFHADEVGHPMYRVSEGVRSTHGQDGAIVLDIGQGQMFNLNLVGSRILELLKGGSAQPEIVDQIVLEFGVSRDRAENDAKEFLQTLEKLHLVESTNQG
jgi:Coenzyme PQQ synthesis protein D (PqqD)